MNNNNIALAFDYLEEVNYADLLLHVVDASYDENQFHINVTNQVLGEIGAADKEKLMVFNKIDLTEEERNLILYENAAKLLGLK